MHNYNYKDIKHVFFINNNIVLFISKLIIDKYKIDEKNILIISTRNTKTDLLRGNLIKIKRFFFLEKVFSRLFTFSLFGFLLRKKLEKLNKKFFLYIPWDTDEAIELQNSKLCSGIAYIEEGQISYFNLTEYKKSKSRKDQKKRLLEKKVSLSKMKSNEDLPIFIKFFNDTSKKYYCLSNNAFPGINNNKKMILNNFQIIKNSYKPKLIKRQNIGIFCSPRRIKGNSLEETLFSLSKYLPRDSALKLHPEMYKGNDYIKKINLLLQKFKREDIFLCDPDTIIEAEMLFEEKNLIGPLTSLIKYAEIFGSNFKKIKIY